VSPIANPISAERAAQAMARALHLAELGRFTTQPNPRVGCVIMQKGHAVGEGYHQRAGGPHAEVLALRAAGDKARGADVFVSLEPCCHQGRTGPCVDALIAARPRKVWAAMQDPNPKVAGQGITKLRKAGIEVDVGLMQAEAEKLNRGFISRMTRGRPFVTLKLAASLDGRTATASGESRWITSEEARVDVHRLRAEAGAVLTSSATVAADDPELTVRLPGYDRQPDRIVLDTHLRSSQDAKVWANGARRVLLTVRPRSDQVDALKRRGVEVLLVGLSANGHVDLNSALTNLGRLEINEVFVECGPRLAGALLQAGLADELLLYLAPTLLGHEARPLAEIPGLARLDQRVQLKFEDVSRIGADLRVTVRPWKS
jgi:diaminohydroxyphosphoribosylaminopyrimidine deaminase/5-amino-6-(5-phosphoribosylamino)uracil reductase